MTREQFLATLYTDAAFRARFIDDAYGTATAAGMDDDDARELARMDLESLRLATRKRVRSAVCSFLFVGSPQNTQKGK